MEIKIKKCGNTRGTIGWLARGLENGSLKITEGKRKNGKHGLWLTEHGPENKKTDEWFLAGLDPYDNDGYMGHPIRYESYGNPDGFHCWTEACGRVLDSIVEQWIDEMNAAIEEEDPIEIKIIRVEKQEVAA